MPRISERVSFNGFDAQVERLGMEPLLHEIEDVVTGFDLLHLQAAMRAGALYAGVLVVPDDMLSRYLTDRTPNLATAIKHIESTAPNATIQVMAFRHDGTGPPLPKARTNKGRAA